MRTWKCRWPGSTPRRLASSRFVRCSVSPAPSVSSTRRRSGCPSAFSCSGWSSVRTSRSGLGSAAAMPLYTPAFRCCLGRQSRMRRPRRRPRAFGLRPSGSGCAGVSGPGGRAERPLDGLRLVLAGDEEDHLAAPSASTGMRQRHALDERLELRPPPESRAARARRASAAPGKSDAVCPSGPSPSRTKSSRASRSELVVLARRLVGAELAADPLHLARRRLDPVEQRSRARAGSSSARRRAARSARRPTRARRALQSGSRSAASS